MDTITHAVPLDGYRIDIRTSSGVLGIFDVKPYLKGSAFKELENISYFRQVTPAHHGIRWSNEQDFSSDTIIWDIQNAQQCDTPNHQSPSAQGTDGRQRSQAADEQCRGGGMA